MVGKLTGLFFMIHIVLHQPEIPNNTGSIIRLCANTGAALHLIKPLGFELDDKKLRRAGLDYHEWASMKVWENLEAALAYLHTQGISMNDIFPMTTKATHSFFEQQLAKPVALLFGAESKGLPEQVRNQFASTQWSRLPMQANSRSLNLANSVSVAVYEAWRQQGFSQ